MMTVNVSILAHCMSSPFVDANLELCHNFDNSVFMNNSPCTDSNFTFLFVLAYRIDEKVFRPIFSLIHASNKEL